MQRLKILIVLLFLSAIAMAQSHGLQTAILIPTGSSADNFSTGYEVSYVYRPIDDIDDYFQPNFQLTYGYLRGADQASAGPDITLPNATMLGGSYGIDYRFLDDRFTPIAGADLFARYVFPAAANVFSSTQYNFGLRPRAGVAYDYNNFMFLAEIGFTLAYSSITNETFQTIFRPALNVSYFFD